MDDQAWGCELENFAGSVRWKKSLVLLVAYASCETYMILEGIYKHGGVVIFLLVKELRFDGMRPTKNRAQMP